jgi:hypothetical protein
MKTITEYQPLIYSAILDGPQRRRHTRRQNLRLAAIGLRSCYALVILAIMAQTGLAAWNWQFWIIFAPVLLLGEHTLQTLTRKLA